MPRRLANKRSNNRMLAVILSFGVRSLAVLLAATLALDSLFTGRQDISQES